LARKVTIDIVSIAREICHNVPANEPGRFIDGAAAQVVKAAVNLAHSGLLPAPLDASLVTRVLYNSWSDFVYYDARAVTGRAEKFIHWATSKVSTLDTGNLQNVVFLYAYVERCAAVPTRWSMPLDQTWVLHAEMRPVNEAGLKIWASSADGSEIALLGIVRQSYLATVPVPRNEFIDAGWAENFKDTAWGYRGATSTMAPNVTQRQAATWAPQKSDTEHFVALPLTLVATNDQQKMIQSLVAKRCRLRSEQAEV
jgi:hypothetical protein